MMMYHESGGSTLGEFFNYFLPSTIKKIWILVPFTTSAVVKNAGGRLELSHTFISRTLNDNNAKKSASREDSV